MADKKILGRRAQVPTYPMSKDFKRVQEALREAGIKSEDIQPPPSVTRSMTTCVPVPPPGATGGTAPDPFEEEQLRRYNADRGLENVTFSTVEKKKDG